MAASAILTLRENDGSAHKEPVIGVDYFTSILPGRWRQNPISKNPVALGAYWGKVEPFVMQSGSQFRVPPPPALTSEQYTAAFNELKLLGGNGTTTPTMRTPDQTIAGIFWCCDESSAHRSSAKMYNQIVMEIADQMGSDAVELARLLALVNAAMADGAIACFESKYYHDFWRPLPLSARRTREPDRPGLAMAIPERPGIELHPRLPGKQHEQAQFTPPSCLSGRAFNVRRRLLPDTA